MITQEDCGGAPLRTTTFSIQFDNGQMRDFTYQYGSGVAQQIDDYVLELVRQVNACAGDRVTFASCTPNMRRRSDRKLSHVTAALAVTPAVRSHSVCMKE